jgi:hypothetical protein
MFSVGGRQLGQNRGSASRETRVVEYGAKKQDQSQIPGGLKNQVGSYFPAGIHMGDMRHFGTIA